MHKGPKVLILDIETAPILAHVWGLFDQTVGINQIQFDWHIMSWAAKWLDKNEVMYMDQRNSKDVSDDKGILQGIYNLMEEADVIVWHHGDQFDHKKLNARFIKQGFKPPSTFKKIDTKKIAKKVFAFTSNKLEYLAEFLEVDTKKRKSRKFIGHELWTECLKGNIDAWNEMMMYNRDDVLALEDVYRKLIPWDPSVNFDTFTPRHEMVCAPPCNSKEFRANGYNYTPTGKYQRFKCKKCGREKRSQHNEHSLKKRKSMGRGTTR